MRVWVYVPTVLRQYSAGERKVAVELDEPATLGGVFAGLRVKAPGVVERALDELGTIRPHVNVFVDGDSIRSTGGLGLQTPVSANAEVWILPAVSGGSA